MKHDDSLPSGDKVPNPVSSERAQRGERSTGPELERPDPDTEAVDKVITPSSIKELEEKTRQIDETLDEVERKKR